MTKPEIFSQEWREAHARAGDDALASINPDDAYAAVTTLAAVAQAHYAAANVRARPTPKGSPHG